MSKNLINPYTLLERIQAVKMQLPSVIKEVMQSREKDLLDMNKENLMQGKDSEGKDMPRYRNAEYAHFKTSINPRNRGFWDLRVMGEYQNWIKVNIYGSNIFFKNTLKNDKAAWLHNRLGTRHLGVTEEQILKFQIENKPEIRAKMLKIINGL